MDSDIFTGDLAKEDLLLEWVISIDSLDSPEKIEEVNSKNLQKYIDTHDYIAVLFCEYD